MKETRITVTEIAKEWPHILGRVQFGGETFVVVKYGKIVARLVPADSDNQKKKRLAS